jgi:hypothetical protein
MAREDRMKQVEERFGVGAVAAGVRLYAGFRGPLSGLVHLTQSQPYVRSPYPNCS